MMNTPTHPPHNAQPSFLAKHWQKLAAAAFWLLLLGSYGYYIVSNELSVREALQQPVDFMRVSTVAPLIFIALYTLRPLVLFSAVALSVAGGALFGPVMGIIYTIIGSNLGAGLAYMIGYFFGQDALKSQDEEAQGRLSRYIDKMRSNSFETVLIMRFIFLPYDLVNYLAGFLRVNFGAFILATILGSLPGTLTFTLLGASSGLSADMEGFNPWMLVGSAVIFVASLAISRLFKRRVPQTEA